MPTRIAWRKVIGVAVILWGIGFTARGLWQWNESPIDPGRRYTYVASRQTLDVGSGLMMVLLGIVVYRRGWKAFER